MTVLNAYVEINPTEIEIEDLQIWHEHEPCEFWGDTTPAMTAYVDWDRLLWNGEPIELTDDSLSQFKSFVLENYQ